MTTVSTPPVGTTLAAPVAQPVSTRRAIGGRSPLMQALTRVVRNPVGLFGLSVLTLLVLCALTAPIISPYNPLEQHVGAELRPPGSEYLLGTDNLGRDLLSRIIYGSRASLLVGVVAVALGAGAGIATGLAA